MHEDTLLRWRLKYDFGWTAGVDYSQPIVGSAHEGQILSWCMANGGEAASAIIRIIQLYTGDDNIAEWTPLALGLIREFWQDAQFTASISNSFNNASYMGSGVSYQKCIIRLYTKLKDIDCINDHSWIDDAIDSHEREAEFMRVRHEEMDIIY